MTFLFGRRQVNVPKCKTSRKGHIFFFLFFELNLWFCELNLSVSFRVLVAVAVLLAKSSCYLDNGNSEFPSL